MQNYFFILELHRTTFHLVKTVIPYEEKYILNMLIHHPHVSVIIFTMLSTWLNGTYLDVSVWKQVIVIEPHSRACHGNIQRKGPPAWVLFPW